MSIPLQIGKVYLTRNNLKVTITAKTSNGYTGNVEVSSLNSVTTLQWTPDGRVMSYTDLRNDNDAQGDYDIVQFLPYG
jgi:hypothetical protein